MSTTTNSHPCRLHRRVFHMVTALSSSHFPSLLYSWFNGFSLGYRGAHIQLVRSRRLHGESKFTFFYILLQPFTFPLTTFLFFLFVPCLYLSFYSPCTYASDISHLFQPGDSSSGVRSFDNLQSSVFSSLYLLVTLYMLQPHIYHQSFVCDLRSHAR